MADIVVDAGVWKLSNPESRESQSRNLYHANDVIHALKNHVKSRKKLSELVDRVKGSTSDDDHVNFNDFLRSTGDDDIKVYNLRGMKIKTRSRSAVTHDRREPPSSSWPSSDGPSSSWPSGPGPSSSWPSEAALDTACGACEAEGAGEAEGAEEAEGPSSS